MTIPPVRVAVLLCTYKRPGVRTTILSLQQQVLPAGLSLEIIVADNDEIPSAKETVKGVAAEMDLPVTYVHAPARNISLARNACLDAATDFDLVAFIDDDEVADPCWLQNLWDRMTETQADAVFGPALAQYASGTPEWMRRQDHHSNRPERRSKRVETGYTCNALLRWNGAPWQGCRFDLGRGLSGGEDTAFFFEIARMGARFEISETAIVHEEVAPYRLSLHWLLRRKYRSGQSYAAVADQLPGRIRLAGTACAKLLVCTLAALATFWSVGRRNFWLLRGSMHLGVVSGCLKLRQPELYGKPQ